MASQTALVVALLSAVQVERAVVPPDNKIYGGDEIDISQVPWTVAILYDNNHYCGGAVISKGWVVTAAHCTFKHNHAAFTLRVGSNAYESGGEEYKVAQIVNHPDYDDVFYANDISLLKSSRSISVKGDVPAVNLPMPGVAPPQVTTSVRVAGWGQYGDANERSPKLKAAENVVIDFSICEQTYKDNEHYESSQFCVKQETGISCTGDSGGPVTIGDVLVGVVSLGNPSCGQSPSVYTKVTYYREWIKKVTGI